MKNLFDRHKLENGKTGIDHYQTQPSNGGDVNYTNSLGGVVLGNSETNEVEESNNGRVGDVVVNAAVDAIRESIPRGAILNAAANAVK